MGLTSVFVGLISLVNDALFAYIISEDGLNSNFNPVDVSKHGEMGATDATTSLCDLWNHPS